MGDESLDKYIRNYERQIGRCKQINPQSYRRIFDKDIVDKSNK